MEDVYLLMSWMGPGSVMVLTASWSAVPGFSSSPGWHHQASSQGSPTAAAAAGRNLGFLLQNIFIGSDSGCVHWSFKRRSTRKFVIMEKAPSFEALIMISTIVIKSRASLCCVWTWWWGRGSPGSACPRRRSCSAPRSSDSRTLQLLTSSQLDWGKPKFYFCLFNLHQIYLQDTTQIICI